MDSYTTSVCLSLSLLGGWLPSQLNVTDRRERRTRPVLLKCEPQPHATALAHRAVLIVQSDVAGRAGFSSGGASCAKRRRCRRRRHRSQKCGPCVHWRQPPELPSEAPALPGHATYYKPASNLHTCRGAVRPASLRPPAAGWEAGPGAWSDSTPTRTTPPRPGLRPCARCEASALTCTAGPALQTSRVPIPSAGQPSPLTVIVTPHPGSPRHAHAPCYHTAGSSCHRKYIQSKYIHT